MLAPYARPDLGRGLLAVATSVVPYLALSALMYFAAGASALLALALAVPTAGFLVRTFVVFHDCSHGSLLASRRANAWLGAALGLIVLAPFRRWQRDHAVHHATSGDLERRGVGDVLTLTIGEYRARSWRGRLGYRLFRNPIVMFGLGPVFAMMIGPRLTSRSQRRRSRRSVLGTDAALCLVVGGLCWLLGWERFLLLWAPAAVLAGAAGIWLFYVQHQFEDAYWQSSEHWSFADAALRGSSHLRLPRLLRFFSGNIGLHHIHHLNARVPSYNLQRAHDENAVFHCVPTLGVLDGLQAVRLKLWDEDRQRLVSFGEADRARRGPIAARAGGAGVAPLGAGVAPLGADGQIPRLRGVSHAVAFVVAIAAAALAVVLAPSARAEVAFSIYGAGLIALFGASALFHRWRGPVRFKLVLRRIDHSAIFVFIAASYTPIALVVIGGTLGWVMLGLAWAGAGGGVGLSLGWIDAPRTLVAASYLTLGWLAVIALPQLLAGLGVVPLVLIALGGVLYSAGALVYACRRPDPWPRTFGFHEVFHALVVAAATAQYVAIVGWILPAAGPIR